MAKNTLINIKLKDTDFLKNTRKQDILGITFARAICSIGIVIFHYFCRSRGNFKFFFNSANSNFGFMFVTSFFCMSGAVLYYNYPKVKSLKIFYFKRWKSIFPSFYICYLYFYFRTVLRFHKIIYKESWKFLLSFIGVDGYFLYLIKSYYLVGEWFLGAIIILYLLYPFLSLILRKNYIFIIYISISIFYYLMYKENFFTIRNDRNLITCLTSFIFGMNAIKFQKYLLENKISLLISLIIFIILCFIKISSFVLIFQIQGFSLFIILVKAGECIMASKFNIIFFEISNISYIIYLYHHQIMFDILIINNSTKWYFHLLSIVSIIILTYIISKIHLIVLKSVFKSNIFQKLESLFI